ncbi:hypothetical protein BAU08_13490 [Bordetella bronchialis]|uniref:VOC domain-containing protein n=2 Tax=Bordetella bronchialis TaxID=463025 RepID=A0A193FXX9_9BORD|nr:hypothetical protein BAU08_13490 [Bordetella bronchialis]
MDAPGRARRSKTADAGRIGKEYYPRTRTPDRIRRIWEETMAAARHLPAARAAVHSIDHFALAMPDVAAARRFFTAFGLDVRDRDGGLELYARGRHCWGRIVPGPRKALAYLLYNCHEADLPGLADQVRAAGGTRQEAPPGWCASGNSVRSTAGLPRPVLSR